MGKTALNRTSVQLLTNKSGGSVAQGDVVVIDTSTASSFTTTDITGYTAQQIGVVVEPNGIANNAVGLIATGGYVTVVNLDSAASLGDFIKTDTVAKQGTPHATPSVAGDFAQALNTGTTPEAILFSAPNWATGDGGDGERYYTFAILGDLTVASGVFRIYNLTGAALTISKVHIAVNTAPTGATILADVNENGTTIFTTQGNRPSIAISAFTGETTTIDADSWDDENYVQVDVDQIGSTIAGADLTVTIVAA